jgi:hypothetical protein
MTADPARETALDTLASGRRALLRLLDGVSGHDLERLGTIGGGDWSAKDLVGHIATWERLALDAVEDRRANRPLRTDQVAANLEAVDRLNAAEIERKRPWPLGRVLSDAESTHAELLSVIAALTDEEWAVPADGGKRALGDVLGRLLGAPRRPFAHVEAHLPDLERFSESAPGG